MDGKWTVPVWFRTTSLPPTIHTANGLVSAPRWEFYPSLSTCTHHSDGLRDGHMIEFSWSEVFHFWVVGHGWGEDCDREVGFLLESVI